VGMISALQKSCKNCTKKSPYSFIQITSLLLFYQVSIVLCVAFTYTHSHTFYVYLFFSFFKFLVERGFELYCLSHISSPFCSIYFGDGASWAVSQGWPETLILSLKLPNNLGLQMTDWLRFFSIWGLNCIIFADLKFESQVLCFQFSQYISLFLVKKESLRASMTHFKHSVIAFVTNSFCSDH
jgi:hypothetical protein